MSGGNNISIDDMSVTTPDHSVSNRSPSPFEVDIECVPLDTEATVAAPQIRRGTFDYYMVYVLGIQCSTLYDYMIRSGLNVNCMSELTRAEKKVHRMALNPLFIGDTSNPVKNSLEKWAHVLTVVRYSKQHKSDWQQLHRHDGFKAFKTGVGRTQEKKFVRKIDGKIQFRPPNQYVTPFIALPNQEPMPMDLMIPDSSLDTTPVPLDGSMTVDTPKKANSSHLEFGSTSYLTPEAAAASKPPMAGKRKLQRKTEQYTCTGPRDLFAVRNRPPTPVPCESEGQNFNDEPICVHKARPDFLEPIRVDHTGMGMVDSLAG